MKHFIFRVKTDKYDANGTPGKNSKSTAKKSPEAATQKKRNRSSRGHRQPEQAPGGQGELVSCSVADSEPRGSTWDGQKAARERSVQADHCSVLESLGRGFATADTAPMETAMKRPPTKALTRSPAMHGK